MKSFMLSTTCVIIGLILCVCALGYKINKLEKDVQQLKVIKGLVIQDIRNKDTQIIQLTKELQRK